MALFSAAATISEIILIVELLNKVKQSDAYFTCNEISPIEYVLMSSSFFIG